MDKANNSRITITAIISIIIGCVVMLFSGLFLNSFVLVLMIIFAIALSLIDDVIILSTLKERKWEYALLLTVMPIIYSVIAPIFSQKLCAYGQPLHGLYEQFNHSSNPYSGISIIFTWIVGSLMSLASLIMSILSIRKKQKPSHVATIKAPKTTKINKILPLIALIALLTMMIIGVINYK